MSGTSNSLFNSIKQYQKYFHPLFQPNLNTGNTFLLDLSIHNPEMKDLDFKNVKSFDRYIFQKIENAGKLYGYGGYMEDREIYRRSALFGSEGEDIRRFHLGVDIWKNAGEPVYCPLDATVHSFQNNNNYGDYGPTIILKHQLQGHVFYTLYGHLSLPSLDGLYEGKIITKGSKFCFLGNFPGNGDYPAHLHFQIIKEMDNYRGDFPGVSSQKDKNFYAENCPDPILFFHELI
ncbi:MAG: peptidoglycan DD-metalloendopeptidase family protein [Bacteroidales bacterium]